MEIAHTRELFPSARLKSIRITHLKVAESSPVQAFFDRDDGQKKYLLEGFRTISRDFGINDWLASLMKTRELEIHEQVKYLTLSALYNSITESLTQHENLKGITKTLFNSWRWGYDLSSEARRPTYEMRSTATNEPRLFVCSGLQYSQVPFGDRLYHDGLVDGYFSDSCLAIMHTLLTELEALSDTTEVQADLVTEQDWRYVTKMVRAGRVDEMYNQVCAVAEDICRFDLTSRIFDMVAATSFVKPQENPLASLRGVVNRVLKDA